MFHFLSGAIMFGTAVAAGFFFKYWRRTKDRLFLIFGIAFVLMACERLVLAFLSSTQAEEATFVYLFRLGAFLLILFAIVDKNRKAG